MKEKYLTLRVIRNRYCKDIDGKTWRYISSRINYVEGVEKTHEAARGHYRYHVEQAIDGINELYKRCTGVEREAGLRQAELGLVVEGGVKSNLSEEVEGYLHELAGNIEVARDMIASYEAEVAFILSLNADSAIYYINRVKRGGVSCVRG